MNMIVTDVKACEKNKERVNIYLDGAFSFAVYAEIAVLEGIAKGAELCARRVEEIKEADAEKFAVSCALRFVASKPRTEKEIRDKLRDKGLSGDATEKALCRLAEYGYVDDRAYAELYAAELQSRYGRHVIRQKMRLKGLPDELIAEALEKGDGRSALKEQLCRYTRRFEREEPYKKKQKIVRALMAKGFDYSDIKAAMAEEDD